MRILRAALVVLGAVAMVATAVAFRSPIEQRHDGGLKPLFEGAQADAAILHIIERACQNCHSEQTHWPWYSRLPPASWLVHRDVTQARARLNLSRWRNNGLADQEALLSAIGAAVRTGVMPPGRY